MSPARRKAATSAWLAAAAIACAAHGLALAALIATANSGAGLATPIPIVVALGDAARLRSEREDVAPGERRRRAVARPQQASQGFEAPVAAHADLSARQRDVALEDAPSADVAALETTAPPAVESWAASSQMATATYEQVLLAHLERRKRYPRAARAHRQQGVAHIRFSMDRQGRVLSVRLVRSAGHALLDREAEALPLRAQPLPPPPADIAGATIELSVPIEFFLER
jgi:protein TonB